MTQQPQLPLVAPFESDHDREDAAPGVFDDGRQRRPIVVVRDIADLPTHLLANVGDRKSLCGIKNPLPCVLARYAQMHVDGRGMRVCADCEAGS